jgi:hypothetical protein
MARTAVTLCEATGAAAKPAWQGARCLDFRAEFARPPRTRCRANQVPGGAIAKPGALIAGRLPI